MSSSNFTIDDLVIDNLDLYESIRKSLTRDPFYHYVNGICGISICLLGIISNALSFSILIRRTMNLSTYVYLAGLCLSDFTACLCLIPGYILDAYPVDIPDSKLPRTYVYTQLLTITGAISTTARVLSVWLCVAFTIDRWIMICRPFVGPLYCTMKNARCMTLIIYIIGVFYALPLMFEYEPYEERGLQDILVNVEEKFYRQKPTRLGRNPVFRWTYALINALGVYVIPLSIIVILNRKLLLSIRSLKRRSEESNAPLPTKQGITIMLLATTVMLLVFRFPSATISVMWLISAKMFVNDKPPFRLRKLHSIANLCATANAATTFIMFLICGAKFRAEFTRIYCCCLRKFNQRKGKTTINQQEQQPFNKLLFNNQYNEQQMSKILNRKIPRKNTRHSSGTTTSTSMGSLPSFKRFRNQQQKPRYSIEQQCDLVNHDNTKNQQLHHQLTIGEDECDNQNKDKTSINSTDSYSDCFKNLIYCR